LSDELLEDEFYKEHKEKEMQLKQKLREARAKLRATIKETPDSELKKEYTINGEPVVVFKAFETKVYLNGVEQK
jgi:hypothetical protein